MLLGTDFEQAISINGEGHADARAASDHRRNTAQGEAGQAAAIFDQIALALDHMQRECGLTVLVSGEILRHRCGNRRVARDDALRQATHRFDAQTQRDHIEQQQIALRVVARKLVG